MAAAMIRSLAVRACRCEFRRRGGLADLRAVCRASQVPCEVDGSYSSSRRSTMHLILASPSLTGIRNKGRWTTELAIPTGAVRTKHGLCREWTTSVVATPTC